MLRRIMIKVSVTLVGQSWKNQGLDAPQVEVITPETETQETDGTVSKKSVVEYRYAKGSIRVSSHYKIYVDGTVDLEQTYLPQGELRGTLPHLGGAFVLEKNTRTFPGTVVARGKTIPTVRRPV